MSERAKKARAREREALQHRAQAAMFAGQGLYNVQPWGFVLGLLGAIFATLLIIDWVTRTKSPVPDGTDPRPQPSEISIELE